MWVIWRFFVFRFLRDPRIQEHVKVHHSMNWDLSAHQTCFFERFLWCSANNLPTFLGVGLPVLWIKHQTFQASLPAIPGSFFCQVWPAKLVGPKRVQIYFLQVARHYRVIIRAYRSFNLHIFVKSLYPVFLQRSSKRAASTYEDLGAWTPRAWAPAWWVAWSARLHKASSGPEGPVSGEGGDR